MARVTGITGWPQIISQKGTKAVTVGWSATNYGRSPAFLTYESIELACVPYPPPREPQYPQFASFPEFAIAPNESHAGSLSLAMSETDLADLVNGRRCLMLHGIFKYRDVLNAPHVTRFCSYYYQQNAGWPYTLTFIAVGPPSYIEYT